MVQITHNGENIERISDIIAAAQNRFGAYGWEKTSVSEIAADLNMSKGSIYYYFPDKESLYKAVIEKEQHIFLQEVKDQLQGMTDAPEMLREFTRINLKFFKTLLNLSRSKLNEIATNPVIRQFMCELQKNEVVLLCDVFKKGTEKGTFKIDNYEEIANLFLDLLKGLRKMIIGRTEIAFLNETDYQLMIQKTNLFAEIFINGLKK